ncbi:hypothetical protein P7C71_g3646, partial [Lecanoromycetidae sp. Uapishka_2]
MAYVRGVLITVTQIIGGIAAAGVVAALFPGPLNVQTSLGGGASIVQGLFIEMFLTALLVFTIFMLAAEKHKATFIAPVGIGLSLFVAELTGVFYTGGSLNPARSFGPSVILHSFFHYHWIYWLGPILGALLASAFYKFIKMLEYETANPAQDSDQKEKAQHVPTAPSQAKHEQSGIEATDFTVMSGLINKVKNAIGNKDGESGQTSTGTGLENEHGSQSGVHDTPITQSSNVSDTNPGVLHSTKPGIHGERDSGTSGYTDPNTSSGSGLGGNSGIGGDSGYDNTSGSGLGAGSGRSGLGGDSGYDDTRGSGLTGGDSGAGIGGNTSGPQYTGTGDRDAGLVGSGVDTTGRSGLGGSNTGGLGGDSGYDNTSGSGLTGGDTGYDNSRGSGLTGSGAGTGSGLGGNSGYDDTSRGSGLGGQSGYGDSGRSGLGGDSGYDNTTGSGIGGNSGLGGRSGYDDNTGSGVGGNSGFGGRSGFDDTTGSGVGGNSGLGGGSGYDDTTGSGLGGNSDRSGLGGGSGYGGDSGVGSGTTGSGIGSGVGSGSTGGGIGGAEQYVEGSEKHHRGDGHPEDIVHPGPHETRTAKVLDPHLN